eukprot:12404630-Karenia_brevis.AAC.1
MFPSIQKACSVEQALWPYLSGTTSNRLLTASPAMQIDQISYNHLVAKTKDASKRSDMLDPNHQNLLRS